MPLSSQQYKFDHIRNIDNIDNWCSKLKCCEKIVQVFHILQVEGLGGLSSIGNIKYD